MFLTSTAINTLQLVILLSRVLLGLTSRITKVVVAERAGAAHLEPFVYTLYVEEMCAREPSNWLIQLEFSQAYRTLRGIFSYVQVILSHGAFLDPR